MEDDQRQNALSERIQSTQIFEDIKSVFVAAKRANRLKIGYLILNHSFAILDAFALSIVSNFSHESRPK